MSASAETLEYGNHSVSAPDEAGRHYRELMLPEPGRHVHRFDVVEFLSSICFGDVVDWDCEASSLAAVMLVSRGTGAAADDLFQAVAVRSVLPGCTGQLNVCGDRDDINGEESCRVAQSILVQWVLARRLSQTGQAIGFLWAPELREGVEPREAGIRTLLKRGYQQIKSAWNQAHPDQKVRSKRLLLKLLDLHACTLGLSPWIVHRSSVPGASAGFYWGDAQAPEQPWRDLPPTWRLREDAFDDGDEPKEGQGGGDEQNAARPLLTFTKALGEHFRSISTKRFKKAELAQLKRLRPAMIESRGEVPLGLAQIILDWAVALLSTGRVQPSTVAGYLGTVINRGLARVPEWRKFMEWSNDEHDELRHWGLFNVHAAETHEKYLVHLLAFYRFLQDSGVVERSRFQLAAAELGLSAGRVHVVSPEDVARLIRKFRHWGTDSANCPKWLKPRDARRVAADLVLAGFLALRPSERRRLRLSDFGFDAKSGYCRVWVLGTKSAAARRAFELHNFAPAWAVELLIQWLQERMGEKFRNGITSPGRIAAFGQFQDHEEPTQYQFSSKTGRAVREEFGDDYCNYSLRHSCLSWMVLRVDALLAGVSDRYPAHFEVFQPEAMHGLQRWLGLDEARDPSVARGTAYLELCAFAGHVDPRMLDTVYGHHADLHQLAHMDRLDQQWCDRIMPKKLAAGILGMKPESIRSKERLRLGSLVDAFKRRIELAASQPEGKSPMDDAG